MIGTSNARRNPRSNSATAVSSIVSEEQVSQKPGDSRAWVVSSIRLLPINRPMQPIPEKVIPNIKRSAHELAGIGKMIWFLLLPLLKL
jgi:hypothetical protein